MPNQFKLTIRVAWWMQLVLIPFSLSCMVVAIFSLPALIKGSIDGLFVFVICLGLAYMGFANALSTIQITEKSVTVTVFYGRFRIDWEEVEKIAVYRYYIALIGHGKRVVLSCASARKSKEKMFAFINYQIELRNLQFEECIEPFPLTHQNARVGLHDNKSQKAS